MIHHESPGAMSTIEFNIQVCAKTASKLKLSRHKRKRKPKFF